MSTQSRIVFQAASLVLTYPDELLLARVELIEDSLVGTSAAPLFTRTLAHLRQGRLLDLQEFHVQEFDMSRRHAMHLTYWTDGDTRRRGEVLAAFKQVYRDSGLVVDLDGELPDHLPLVLEFAAQDPERGRRLLGDYRASLELLRLGLRKDSLPHEGVVEAICRELGGPLATSRADVQKLYGLAFGDAPPIEQVGLQTYQIQTSRPV